MKSTEMTVTDKDGTITAFKVISVKDRVNAEQEASERQTTAKTINRN